MKPTGAPCSGTQYFASDAKCHNGINFPATFNLGNVAVPRQFIYGITFNTETFGPNPTGVPGPYIALNVAVNSTAPPTVGTRPNPDTAYLNGDNNAAYNRSPKLSAWWVLAFL